LVSVSARTGIGSFFAVEIIRLAAFNYDAIRRRRFVHFPFPTVRIISRFTDRIIRDHIIREIVLAGVADLVRFIGPEDKRVAGDNVSFSTFITHTAFAADDEIKFPRC